MIILFLFLLPIGLLAGGGSELVARLLTDIRGGVRDGIAVPIIIVTATAFACIRFMEPYLEKHLR